MTAIKYHLDNLSLQEATGYINHRLKVAGRNEPIFTQEALELIYDRTGGIPRRINRLCDICLLSGMIKETKEISEGIVLEEAKELGG